MDYHRKRSELTSYVYKIGLNYNQAVNAFNRRPELPQLKNAMVHISLHTKKLIEVMEEAISLTRDFRKKNKDEK
ncbi:MAG: hypothetical protein SOW35_07620 [Porphyromonas somerae]|nr:hypothetical protein [Porphyromonas somerae]MDY3120806.1 hypothetical protein [Porphyromonas somerae]